MEGTVNMALKCPNVDILGAFGFRVTSSGMSSLLMWGFTIAEKQAILARERVKLWCLEYEAPNVSDTKHEVLENIRFEYGIKET